MKCLAVSIRIDSWIGMLRRLLRLHVTVKACVHGASESSQLAKTLFSRVERSSSGQTPLADNFPFGTSSCKHAILIAVAPDVDVGAKQ
jgi:hypothetical protein